MLKSVSFQKNDDNIEIRDLDDDTSDGYMLPARKLNLKETVQRR